ncbi:Proteasome subunit alpha type-6 [Acorus gramineus]|uniref:Proteasome subunit alpha type-6 n=1 Tax=Acorus gramineus TaxID=55184 RepID=A0AAV9BFS9_ACOGR|nr:Proteasome subunit alpha type-6 [Acorus gramineus]
MREIAFGATSAGLKEQEAINFLEKKMKNDPALSYEEIVQKLTYLRRSEQQRKGDENKQRRVVRATGRHFREDEGS